MSMLCPHCGKAMHIRTSKTASLLSKESYYRCSNDHCGHIAIGVTELIRTVVPANHPNPNCALPVVKPDPAAPPV
ncbi:ogr/Delta-like zinc finger family protein [Chitinibacter tainanensis]|uniref:ogr/Delta-like zinc finger family protein n=1 Tax=Chitinibacter tainanensis TaxID=230667 RepID=UPI003570A5A7